MCGGNADSPAFIRGFEAGLNHLNFMRCQAERARAWIAYGNPEHGLVDCGSVAGVVRWQVVRRERRQGPEGQTKYFFADGSALRVMYQDLTMRVYWPAAITRRHLVDQELRAWGCNE